MEYDFVNAIKRNSTNWINDNIYHDRMFGWQEGYGVFSYSEDATKDLVNYVKTQAEHHKAETFYNEYKKMISDPDGTYNEYEMLEDV